MVGALTPFCRTCVGVDEFEGFEHFADNVASFPPMLLVPYTAHWYSVMLEKAA